MEKIYILGNSETVRQLGYNFIAIPNLTNDYEIHNWMVSLFQKNTIDKLVIEMGSESVLPLKLGMHIRLSIDDLREKSLIPIFYVSAFPLNTIMIDAKVWSHLLASKGVYFSTFDNLEKIKIELSVIESISPDEYKTGFLDVVKILPDETIGRHSLANTWGAYSMDKSANTNALSNNADFQKNRTKLYFKYVSAFNFDFNLLKVKIVGRIPMGEANSIKAKGKKILLIDDEANKGWELVLRKVFKTSTSDDFRIIGEKIKDYDAFSAQSKELIEKNHFDLYLIDLRLNGTEEENTLKPNDFSGMKVLNKIKSLNQGNQVIIFTASNKVWNLKALLDAGADGYYMKESPEFGFSAEFSEQNYKGFQGNVKACFDRDFLKTLCLAHQKIVQRIEGLATYPNDFKAELKNQFQLFWEMILIAKTKTQFAYAYITLYMVIEIINRYFIKQTSNNQWDIKETGLLWDWNWNKEKKKYENSETPVFNNNPSESQKFTGLYFQKWNGVDQQLAQNIFFLIQKRNGFVHNDKNILDKKNEKGQYLNRDIFTKEACIKLFESLEKIICLL